MSNEDNTMVLCDNLVKIYKTGETEVMALQGLDMTVERDEFVAIIGSSGSGKSTLLNMLGGLDTPTMGQLSVDGFDMLKMSRADLTAYKRNVVGFVWQNNARNLLPYLTAWENVELVGLVGSNIDKDYCTYLFDMVGLNDRKRNKLSELSNGEQQRVATVISLINKPKLLLADEPTGSLDTRTSERIMELFDELRTRLGITIIIVTHDPKIAKLTDRVVSIRDGKRASEILRKEQISSIANLASLEDEHLELAVVDRSGRVQLPDEYLTDLSIAANHKVRIDKEDGKIAIYPVDISGTK